MYNQNVKKKEANQTLSWDSIKKKFKDQWVALINWSEDKHGDITGGQVVHTAKNRQDFYAYVNKHFVNRDLAVRYTGNVRGPFFLTQ